MEYSLSHWDQGSPTPSNQPPCFNMNKFLTFEGLFKVDIELLAFYFQGMLVLKGDLVACFFEVEYS